MRLDSAYTRYAEIYDRIGQRRFGEDLARVTLDWLAAAGFRPCRAVDLACGTGAAAYVLARAGLHVYGVDRSPSMLAAAAAIEPVNADPIEWLSQDIRDLDLPGPVDLATCFYDAVNYLATDTDFASTARAVARSLAPGGWFVFDVNTRRRLSEGWDRTTMVAADDDQTFVVYRSWFDERSGISPLIVTGFIREPDGNWQRFDEEHIERAFDLEFLDGALAEAGFDPAHRFDYLPGPASLAGPGTESSQRVVYFAQRVADETVP